MVSTYVPNPILTSANDRFPPLIATIFIVNVDNVGSNQMHQIRTALRGKGVVLMGKNTMVRRALRNILAENPQYERLLPHVKGNVGFVFTASDLKEVREIITANKVKAPARAGAVAPIDVVVSAGNTGMEPGKTSFFQALSIPTKIARGTIEIVSDIKVVVAGTKVGPSEATLLNMLNISPFTYGMTVAQIFSDGTAFSPSVLDIDEQELIDRFLTGIKTVACISLALNYPTVASVSHSLVNAYKNLLAVSLETEYSFEGADKVRSSSSLYRASALLLLSYVMYKKKPTYIHTENSDRLQYWIGDDADEIILTLILFHFLLSARYPFLSFFFFSFSCPSHDRSGTDQSANFQQIKEYLANPEAFAATAAPTAAANSGAGGGGAPEPAAAEPEEESDDDMVSDRSYPAFSISHSRDPPNPIPFPIPIAWSSFARIPSCVPPPPQKKSKKTFY